MINVIITTSTFPRWKNDILPGFVFNLAQQLSSSTCSVTVIAPDHLGTKKHEVFEDINIIRHRYFLPRKWEKLCYGGGIINNLRRNPLLYFQIPFYLVSQFVTVFFQRIKKPDSVLNAHWIFPQGMVAIALKVFFRIPLVLTVHGGDIFYRQKGLIRVLTYFVLKKADVICCVSSAIRNTIVNHIPELRKRIHVISMGVDVHSFSNEKKNNAIKKELDANPLLIYAGRLTEKKGIRYLIESMPNIVQKYPKAKLVIIGYGVQEPVLKQLVNTLHLHTCVIFLGKKPHEVISQYLASSDLFIGPSIIAGDKDQDGLPVSFIEAMASGCPVITTDLPGNYDLIIPNTTGFIITQKDSDVISQTVIRVMENANLRENVKKNARKKIEDSFSWQKIASDYCEIFLNIKKKL